MFAEGKQAIFECGVYPWRIGFLGKWSAIFCLRQGAMTSGFRHIARSCNAAAGEKVRARYRVNLFAKSTIMLATIAAGNALAQETIDVPPPPPPLQSGEALEPEVTIIQREDEKVYEYKVGGRVYMVKVVPVAGPAYYFLDQDGDGELDATRYGPEEISVPQWVLFRW